MKSEFIQAMLTGAEFAENLTDLAISLNFNGVNERIEQARYASLHPDGWWAGYAAVINRPKNK